MWMKQKELFAIEPKRAKDGQWRTLNEIAYAVGGSPASVSARLRDLRKPKYGGRTVDRLNVGRGLFQYRVRT